MIDGDVRRRLAAILVGDVAGYSRLMGDDDSATIATLTEYREVFRAYIEAHGGRVVDMTGDSVLAVFDTASGAVQSAIETQGELSKRNETLPDARRMDFRIGVNLGDIREAEDGAVYGDGVNVAARLETMAPPGGINVSGSVFDSVRSKIDLPFDFLGEHKVKNIADPVRVWCWSPKHTAEPNNQFSSPSHCTPEKVSIAVLPFTNMSGDLEQEYFSDGVSEDLTTALSRFDWLFVIARNSAFTYKNQPIDIRQVGRELGVRYVLEGSVRRAGGRVRINAQLVDAIVDRHVWAERYDREMDDIFDLQDDIVASISATVGPEITLAEIERTRSQRSVNPDVWDSYLRALSAFHRMTHKDILSAISLLEGAIETDPDYAKAYALLGLCHAEIGMRGWVKPVSQAYKAALDSAEKSVQLAPSSPETNFALGFVLNVSGSPEEAVSALRRALDLNPNYAEAYAILGQALNFCGEQEKGLAACKQAERGSPRNPRGSYLYDALGHIHFMMNDYEKAIEASQKAVRQDPSTYGAYVTLAGAYANLGQQEEARRNVDALLQLIPRYSLRALRKNPFFIKREQIDKLVESMRLAGLPE